MLNKNVNETKGKNGAIWKSIIHADDDVENGHIIITESSIHCCFKRKRRDRQWTHKKYTTKITSNPLKWFTNRNKQMANTKTRIYLIVMDFLVHFLVGAFFCHSLGLILRFRGGLPAKMDPKRKWTQVKRGNNDRAEQQHRKPPHIGQMIIFFCHVLYLQKYIIIKLGFLFVIVFIAVYCFIHWYWYVFFSIRLTEGISLWRCQFQSWNSIFRNFNEFSLIYEFTICPFPIIKNNLQISIIFHQIVSNSYRNLIKKPLFFWTTYELEFNVLLVIGTKSTSIKTNNKWTLSLGLSIHKGKSVHLTHCKHKMFKNWS